MAEPTTAAERAAWMVGISQRGLLAVWDEAKHWFGDDVLRLIADVERLTEERDELAILKADAELDLLAAEAQRDEAVGRVKTYHGAEILAEQKAGRDTHDLACDTCIFLASFSTVTEAREGIDD